MAPAVRTGGGGEFFRVNWKLCCWNSLAHISSSWKFLTRYSVIEPCSRYWEWSSAIKGSSCCWEWKKGRGFSGKWNWKLSRWNPVVHVSSWNFRTRSSVIASICRAKTFVNNSFTPTGRHGFVCNDRTFVRPGQEWKSRLQSLWTTSRDGIQIRVPSQCPFI